MLRAVKVGDPKVEALKHGFRYVADPRQADLFICPAVLLQWCAEGACAGDCDDGCGLICALLAAIGFRVGLRAWGPNSSGYTHVYPVAGISKRNPTEAIGLDWSVDESYVKWEPPGGVVMTCWLD